MGRALIVAAVGDGLYRARPLYDMRRIDARVAELTADQAAHAQNLINAINSKNLLEDETRVAKAALDAVIDQWQNDLLNSGTPDDLDPPTDNDPETGLPWEPSDKAQEGPLLDAINAARAAASKPALTRAANLDLAARRHVYDMSGRRLLGHIGSDQSVPSSRVQLTGYQADVVVELVACGPFTATSAVNAWKTGNQSTLYSEAVTEIGVAYTYSTHHPATFLWIALLAHPDPDPPPLPTSITFPDDPARLAAREQEAAMERIEAPKTEAITPERLGAVVGKYAIAARKLEAAERELTRIQQESVARSARLAELQALKTDLETRVYDVWSVSYNATLAVGATVNTVEPPGWMDYSPPVSVTVDTGGPAPYSVSYQERRWNLAPGVTGTQGQLAPAEAQSPEGVFYNAAMEPGWARWKPLCRYGVITDHDPYTDFADVRLEAIDVRLLDHENPSSALILDPAADLSSVPIHYPPCNGRAFHADDEVVILFEGQDRDKPKIIGFRRAARWCALVAWGGV